MHGVKRKPRQVLIDVTTTPRSISVVLQNTVRAFRCHTNVTNYCRDVQRKPRII